MLESARPRDWRVSTTEAALTVPVEFESRTEKDSRIEWRSCGGSLESTSVCGGCEAAKFPGLLAAAEIENELMSVLDGDERPRVVGDGGGSVCDRAEAGGSVLDRKGCGLILGSSSSSLSCSDIVNDCLSFEGDAIGEGPVLPGGVNGLPTTVLGEPGEDGRRKGEVRGELKERPDGL